MLDGSRVAGEIKHELKRQRLGACGGDRASSRPGHHLVGDDAPSHTYVTAKHRDCAEVGIASIRRELPGDASEADVLAAVDELNSEPRCTRFIVQLPRLAHVNMPTVLQAIDPVRNADGLHPTNLGQLVLGAPAPLPCTPRGIIELLLRRHNINISARSFASSLWHDSGKLTQLMLTRPSEYAAVTLCREATRRRRGPHTRSGDRGRCGRSRSPREARLDNARRDSALGWPDPADSFSDGGRYVDASAAIRRGMALANHGWDLIDVGGESTRPSAVSPPPSEELARIVPVAARG